jgi:MFS superfamily sulfate permease-like transporter
VSTSILPSAFAVRAWLPAYRLEQLRPDLVAGLTLAAYLLPAEITPGALVARCESSLVYFNAEHARERLFELVRKRADGVRLVVLFLSTTPRVDLAGAELLTELHQTFRAGGVEFRLAEAHGEVRDALRRTGFENVHVPLGAAQTVDVILEDWRSRGART